MRRGFEKRKDPCFRSSALMRFVRELDMCNTVAGTERLTAGFDFVGERAEEIGKHEVVAKLDEINRLFEINEKAGSSRASWRVQ